MPDPIDDKQDEVADGADGTVARPRYFVQSLERGLAVICAFGEGSSRLTLREVASKTGLSRAAARRFLLTLADLSYVERDGSGFQLKPRVLELGYSYLSGLSLTDVALPHLEQLSIDTEEASEAGILDGEDVVFILRVPGPGLMTLAINVGARLPAHVTALGRALLAGLPEDEFERYLATAKLQSFGTRTVTNPDVLRALVAEVRREGWSIVDQEFEEGFRAIAAPVHDRLGRVIAAVNLSTHPSRRTLESLKDDLLPALLATTARIEAELQVAAVRTAALHG